MSETPVRDDTHETFTETLATVAETAHDHMRPFPVAAVRALSRRRRRQRSLAVLSLAATTCAVAVAITLGVGSSGQAVPVPPIGSTPTVVPDLTAVPAEFLQPSELPGAAEFAWQLQEVAPQSLTEGLPMTCGQVIGGVYTHDVRNARYHSTTGHESINETVFTYDSPEHAADRMAKLTPTCGAPSSFIHNEDGFAWTEPNGPMVDHMVVARHGAQIATVQFIDVFRNYDSTRDTNVLASLVRHLAATAFLSPDQIPFPDGSPWRPGEDTEINGISVTDVCAAASDPVNLKPGPGQVVPQGTTVRSWAPSNRADVSPAMESIHVFASPDDARSAFHKVKSLYDSHTCRTTTDTVGNVTRTITPGYDVDGDDSTGFVVGASDSYVGASDTGTKNHFRTYVVLKNSAIAVVMVPVTKEHVADMVNDAHTVAAIADHLP